MQYNRQSLQERGKYIEYLKSECEGKNGTRCDFCEGNEWIDPACTFVPPPMPNESRLPEYHYKRVRDTPAQINGCMREIDDFQPRIQIKKVVKEDELSLGDGESVEKNFPKLI